MSAMNTDISHQTNNPDHQNPAAHTEPQSDGSNSDTDSVQSSTDNATVFGNGKSLPLEPEYTPLPKMQMLILTIILISEPMTSAILFPFIYFMIKDFHLSDDEMVIGSYAGWITSIFFIGQLFSAIPWGRCSDQHGRRPVLLTGLIGNAVSTFAFGLSKNLWWAIASRAICGIMNGNTAVARSMLAEITDETNRPFAFSIFGFCWGIGLIVGPALGGFLCNPVEQFPSLFGDSEFFKYYPYLLPCIVSALFTLSGWIIGYFYLKESNPSVLARKYNDQKLKDDQKTPNVADEQTKLLGTSKQTFYDGGSPIKSNSLSIASEEEMVTAKAQGSSLSRITRQSYAAIVCYTLWGFQCMAFEEVIPLFYSTPLSAGGLGMDPQEIAKIFAICGIQQTFSQFIVYPMLNRAYSTLTCARLALIVFVPIYMIFPELSPLKVWMFSHTENENMWQWAFYISFMVLLFIRYTGSTTSHVSYMVLVSNSADPEIIGTVNGVCQTALSLVRALAPALGGTLWAISLRPTNVFPFDQHLVYYLLALVSLIGLYQTYNVDNSISIGGKKPSLQHI